MMCYSLEWLGLIKTLLSASAYVIQTQPVSCPRSPILWMFSKTRNENKHQAQGRISCLFLYKLPDFWEPQSCGKVLLVNETCFFAQKNFPQSLAVTKSEDCLREINKSFFPSLSVYSHPGLWKRSHVLGFLDIETVGFESLGNGRQQRLDLAKPFEWVTDHRNASNYLEQVVWLFK